VSEPTILLVDDDAVLSQVLRRVLARQGYAVVEAASAADAVELARQRRPQLGLIDLSLPDGDGVELARRLEQEVGPLPLILMTAYPLRLRDEPELTQGFAHVLTKPLNLDEVRQIVAQTLASSPSAAVSDAPLPAAEGLPGTAEAPAPPGDLPSRAPHRRPHRRRWVVPGAAAALVLLCSLAWPALGLPNPFSWFHKAPAPAAGPAVADRVQVVPGDPDGLELPEAVVNKLGVTTTVLQTAAKPRTLELAGSLSFDPDRLYRIQARFAGEVIALGKFLEPGSSETGGQTRERDLRYGDPVRKGDLMAIVLSKDLGEKKSELVDALVRQHLDEVNLRFIEEMAARGVTPEVVLRQQRATVAADRNAAVRAELTLRTWRLPEAEIEAVKGEAKRVQDLGGKRDLAKETEWAKVEVRAPADGVIVEKNVAVGNIVDTTFDLYKVANLRKLGVLVHAYEEDLRTLQALPRNFPWQVRVSADPRAPVLKSDGIEQLGLVVDPNQHTDPVMGRVDNTSGELKVGQFVTALVDLPAPPDVVSVPADALDENGSESVVFAVPDPTRPRVFSMRRVAVAQRLGSVVYVRSVLTADQKARGLQPMRPGDVVVIHGVVELKATLEEVQAKKEG
jgi:cobalt-zinc-cadmium efflux system membrane fusion protein